MQTQDGRGEEAGESLLRTMVFKKMMACHFASRLTQFVLLTHPRWLTLTDVDAWNLVRIAT